ncbi:MAG: carboxypeptidase-like regulatory domain-containing protein [bacterium]
MIRNSSLTVALTAVLVHCSPFVYEAEFAERTDTSRRGDLLGPFTGQVVDSGTGNPVPKALVYASWGFVRGVGFVVPGGAGVYVTKTDDNGMYTIPKLAELPSGATQAIAGLRLVVYKRGFVAYRSDRIFPGNARRFDFVQVENKIRLERWNPDLSHVDHVRFIGGHGPLVKASAWEVQAAVAQLEGRPLDGSAGGSSSTEVGKGLLNAAKLLDEDDIEDVTGYDGGFLIQRLKDIPRSARYDSRHFRAEGKTQRFDAAYRVWRLGTAAAARHYKKLLAAYPGATPKDELGQRSFRARNKDIGAVVWLTSNKGIVVALTCGWSLCKDDDKLLKVARLIHDRLDRLDRPDEDLKRVLPDTNVNPFQPVQPRVPVLK